ncbi:conjugal transfer protein TraF [Candidatus Poribacteria bacterium]
MSIRGKTLLATNLTLICFFVFIGSNLLASEGEDAKDHRLKSVRAMGMGNAFAAIANDGDAFYYNPAGLATIRNTRFDIQPVRFIPSEDFYDQFRDINNFLDDLEAISDNQEWLEDPDLEDERRRLMERLESLVSDYFLLDTAIPVRAIVPLHVGNYGLSVGVMAHAWSMSEIAVQRRGLDWSDFIYDVLDDELLYSGTLEASYGAAAAIEFPMSTLPLELSFGITARRIRRWRLTDEDDLLGLEDLMNPYGKDGIEGTSDDLIARFFDPEDPWENVAEGEGYSVDIGSIGTINDAINVAVVVQNLVGHVDYDEEEDDDLPLNVGASAAVNLARLGGSGISNLDIILAAEVDRTNKARMGLEVVLDLPLLALSGRIGSNRGFMTLGAGIQLMFLDFDYAFYADDDADWHAFSLNLAF